MPNTGSCFCGEVAIEYSGEPKMTALCHCIDCKKISGGLFSSNYLIPAENFKVTKGTPATIEKTADSGKSITNNFCKNCGSTLFRFGDTFGGRDGLIIIKSGVLDDQNLLNDTKPGVELYAPERVSWIPKLDDANQVEAMPPA